MSAPGPTSSRPTDADQTLSLRERKRLAAMHRIQSVALASFVQHGFEQVTIEQIAADAEVSPSTVYRHFGTKERIVLWDDYDPVVLAGVFAELQHHPPIEAIRRVVFATMAEVFQRDEARIRTRLDLAFSTPSIESALALQTYEMAEVIASVLAQRLGRDPGELDIEVFAHAFAGGLLGGLRHWYASGYATPFEDILERPIAVLEHGMQLD